MYTITCYASGELVATFCCTTKEVAELRMKLLLLEFPYLDCVLDTCKLWSEEDLDYINSRIVACNHGKEN